MNITAETYNTPEYLRRVESDWKKVTKEEKIDVQNLSGVFYAFGSELACLRLYKYYSGAKNVRCAYSENLKTWYFTLELKFN